MMSAASAVKYMNISALTLQLFSLPKLLSLSLKKATAAPKILHLSVT